MEYDWLKCGLGFTLTYAILRSNGNEIEILNGADPNTLTVVLNLIGK